ncbi:MAG: PilT domain protein [Candidatus Bathyarchaeota archaeon B63]|nr:MAG: PilT domain protein [Candidatus Bathyarchaeota archaeon B63]
MQFSAALRLAGKCRVIDVERGGDESYDDVIFRVAREMGAPVATNDAELRRRLRKAGIPTVYLRQRNRIVIEGYA